MARPQFESQLFTRAEIQTQKGFPSAMRKKCADTKTVHRAEDTICFNIGDDVGRDVEEVGNVELKIALSLAC